MRTSFLALSLIACTASPPPAAGPPNPLVAPPVNCTTTSCTYADEPIVTAGYHLFSEDNFADVIDGWGNRRHYLVHIPATYDMLPADQRMPLIFAFHGGDQKPMDMVKGIWDAYFEQDYAFVFPLGEKDPCDSTGIRNWMQPGLGVPNVIDPVNCPTETQVATGISYWSASLSGTFTDVRFVEDLRSRILSRFPKLDPNKVYATGFSSGGGMTLTLACYRSNLFRGFSAVGKSLYSVAARGDYNQTGATDPASLTATCGRNIWDPAHATGIAGPELWGNGTSVPINGGPIAVHNAKPVTVFWGNHDDNTPSTERESTVASIRERNNLATTNTKIDPFEDVGGDSASTERRTFETSADMSFPSAGFRRFMVTANAMHPNQAGHALPDVNRCGPGTIMTCDYNYTDQTVEFWTDYADLDTTP